MPQVQLETPSQANNKTQATSPDLLIVLKQL
jgi:hypothetical protein